MTIELTIAEQELLGEIVQNALGKLEIEIRHTDHAEFREILKQRREALNDLVEKLQTPAVFKG